MGCGEGDWGVVVSPLWEESPEKIFWNFSLEISRFGANPVVYCNKNVRLFTVEPRPLLYITGG